MDKSSKAQKNHSSNSSSTPEEQPVTTDQPSSPQTFVIDRLYTKDISFEAPGAPATFQEPWKPEVKLELNTQSHPLAQDVHEVILSVTVTVKLGEKTAFIAEVKQAGIFTARGFPEDSLRQVLGSFCPNLLFPYAREAISDLVIRGGFPALYLAPIDFDRLYQAHLKQQKQVQQTGDGETTIQ